MSKKRLLIVEDSKPIALVIERMALSVGFKATIANSFAEVKKLLVKEHDYFLATVDYSLPDAPDGQVVPYIIEHGIPAIIMTGRIDENTRKKLLNFPIVDYITKENTQAYHYLMRVLYQQLTNHKIGVLVVDDSLTGRNQLKQLLARRNFTIYPVSDGTRALQVLENEKDIKLVITNNEMSGMDGIELIQKIRKNHSRNQLIIIGISSEKSNSQSARFLKNGADDFLTRPFCPEEFYCRVTQNIEKLQYIEEISTAANTDFITKLANRRHFIEIAGGQLKDPLLDPELIKVLAVVHIDDFKGINDKYKHQAGDEVLVSFSSLLSEQLAEKAAVSRLNGAEFAVFLMDRDKANIESNLKSLQAAASKHVVKKGDLSISFTVSIGGLVVEHNADFPKVLESAVEALKQASKKGRSQLVLHGLS